MSFKIIDWLPVGIKEGPPLPKILEDYLPWKGRWPWYKESVELPPEIIPGKPDFDLDHDGVVDDEDTNILLESYMATPTLGIWNPQADFNNDGVIDSLDLSLLAQNYTNAFTPPEAPPETEPPPTSPSTIVYLERCGAGWMTFTTVPPGLLIQGTWYYTGEKPGVARLQMNIPDYSPQVQELDYGWPVPEPEQKFSINGYQAVSSDVPEGMHAIKFRVVVYKPIAGVPNAYGSPVYSNWVESEVYIPARGEGAPTQVNITSASIVVPALADNGKVRVNYTISGKAAETVAVIISRRSDGFTLGSATGPGGVGQNTIDVGTYGTLQPGNAQVEIQYMSGESQTYTTYQL
jgi:hypothetical protein